MFIQLFTAIRGYDLERLFLPWLYRIAVRRAVDEARRGRRTSRENTDDNIPDRPSPGPSTEDKVMRSLLIEAIWSEVESMDAKHRAVAVLFYYHEYKGDEIAEILDIPPETVRSRLSTVRRRLREIRAAWADPPDPPETTGPPEHPPSGPDNQPSNGSLAESVQAVANRVGWKIGAASEQPVGRKL